MEAFVNREIGFTDIWRVVGQTMEAHEVLRGGSIEELVEADEWARGFASGVLG